MARIRIGGLALTATLLVAAPVAHAGGANDSKRELVGWSPDGRAYVLRGTDTLAGDEVEYEVEYVGNPSVPPAHPCGGDCNAKTVARALKRGTLVAGGFAPAGVSAGVKRVGHRLVFRLQIGQRWVRLGSEKTPRGVTHYTWSHSGTSWAPTQHVVAFKIETSTNWGVAGQTDHAQRYYVFRLPPKIAKAAGVPGLLRDTVRWKRRAVAVSTSSTLYAGSPFTYRPARLFSGKGPWCEGAKGAGYTTRIVYDFGRKVRLTGFRVKPGFHRTAKLWRLNNRVMLLRIEPEGWPAQTALFQDERRRFTVKLKGGPRRVRRVFFTLMAVFPGYSRTSHDTCITELLPY